MESIVSLVQMFQKGGSVMYVLLLLSIFVVAIAIERYMYFKSNDSGRKFARTYYDLMEEKRYEEAKALAANTKGATASILTRAAADHLGHVSDLSAFMNIQSGIEIAKFNERLYFLSVIVTMGPLLGLLGTISGMISSFSVLNTNEGAMAITGGVGEALIATAMGLLVALVALVVHSYYKQRIEGIVTDMEQVFSELEVSRKSMLKVGGSDHEVA